MASGGSATRQGRTSARVTTARGSSEGFEMKAVPHHTEHAVEISARIGRSSSAQLYFYSTFPAHQIEARPVRNHALTPSQTALHPAARWQSSSRNRSWHKG